MQTVVVKSIINSSWNNYFLLTGYCILKIENINHTIRIKFSYKIIPTNKFIKFSIFVI